MTIKEANAKIKETMKSLNISEDRESYTVKELNMIADGVGIDMFYVMQYIRFGKITVMARCKA